ncbi:hypothetical protein AAK912_04220 [Merdimmobilis hominis]|uniref:hypothetical protein n=1 Tax=Merdimmobilis hominis TaxID=2897707 RepID=UPI003514D6A1
MEKDKPNLRKLTQYINDRPGDPRTNMMRVLAVASLVLPKKEEGESCEIAQ